MKKYEFVVSDDNELEQANLYLIAKIREYTKDEVKKNIDKGNLLVNGESVKQTTKLKVNDKLEFVVYGESERRTLPENIAIDIIYEDDDIIVVNKPQGMVVHPSPGHLSGTLLNAILYHISQKPPEIAKKIKVNMVHRIDRDTSGILVVSKNNEAHNHLTKQFVEHTVNRKYHAIVHNNIIEDEGTVDQPIAREVEGNLKRIVDHVNGQNAVTHYKVLKRFGEFTYIECYLDTGRTHQIRVHMAHIGHPLLGDDLYGSDVKVDGLQGQALHAKVLGFIHPTTNEYVEFEKEVPEYFGVLLEKLRS